jgi:hypothetical protein
MMRGMETSYNDEFLEIYWSRYLYGTEIRAGMMDWISMRVFP